MIIPFVPVWVNRTIYMVFMVVDMYIINLGASLAMPTFKSLLTNAVDEKKQGVIAGIDESILALSNGLAPALAGAAYALTGAWSFIAFGVLMIVPHAIIFLREGNWKITQQWSEIEG